jgi:hypothetical protein
MNPTVTRTIATLALLAGLAACGTADTSGTANPGSPSDSTTPVATPPHDFAQAKAVTLVRSGGIRGGTDTWRFAADQPPPNGFSKADLAAILTAAADPDLKSQTESSPGNPCCDRYLYRVTVTWPDGTSRTFATVDGESRTPELAKLLHLMAAT